MNFCGAFRPRHARIEPAELRPIVHLLPIRGVRLKLKHVLAIHFPGAMLLLCYGDPNPLRGSKSLGAYDERIAPARRPTAVSGSIEQSAGRSQREQHAVAPFLFGPIQSGIGGDGHALLQAADGCCEWPLRNRSGTKISTDCPKRSMRSWKNCCSICLFTRRILPRESIINMPLGADSTTRRNCASAVCAP